MRCEDEKMFYRPPLLEEPCAQTLSGKSVNPNALEMLTAMFARTVQVGNKKMFMPTSAKKCDAKVLPTNSTTPK